MRDISPEHVEAAVAAVSAYGLRRTSLTDVAARAGISRATAYRIFGTRDRMLTSVWAAGVTAVLEDVDAALPADAGLEDVVRTFIERAHLRGAHHPIVVRAIHEEADLLTRALIEQPGEFSVIRYGSAAIAAWLEERGLGDQLAVSTEQLAEAMVRTVISLLLTPSSSFDARALARFLARGAALAS